jgi:hypothetical protein
MDCLFISVDDFWGVKVSREGFGDALVGFSRKDE